MRRLNMRNACSCVEVRREVRRETAGPPRSCRMGDVVCRGRAATADYRAMPNVIEYSTKFFCPNHDFNLTQMEERLFNLNSAVG